MADWISAEFTHNLLVVNFKSACTYKFEHVPIKYIIISKALSMEQISEQLSQVGIVRFVIKP